MDAATTGIICGLIWLVLLASLGILIALRLVKRVRRGGRPLTAAGGRRQTLKPVSDSTPADTKDTEDDDEELIAMLGGAILSAPSDLVDKVRPPRSP